MPKINQEEYEILKEALNEGYEWIARDKDSILEKYKEEPYKFIMGDVWRNEYNFYGETHKYLGKDLFHFIQWEDEEPYEIAELIEGYEKDYKGSWEHAIEFSREVFDESEETEVKKDKQWLEKELRNLEKLVKEALEASLIAKNENYTEKNSNGLQLLRRVFSLVNQLDEPEVLSTDWIKNNQRMWASTHGVEYHVPANKLYGKVVPKQKEITEEQAWEVLSELYDIPNKSYIREAMRVVANYVGDDMTIGELKEKFAKPVIPQFVADWLDFCKEENMDLAAAIAFDEYDRRDRPAKVSDWLHDGSKGNSIEIFARAWLDGYEVIEEQKYVIDTDDVEISDGNHYLTHLSLSKNDTELPIVGYKDDAIRFDNKEQAQAIADYVGGRVEELEE